MTVILASDFPTSAPPRIVDRMKAAGERPRIAWIASDSTEGRAGFPAAVARFAELGFDNLEYCDIDEERDEVQLAFLYEFDIVYLSGADPLRFRYNMLRTGLSGRLRQCVTLDRLIVAASGGAPLLTPNVSLYRLQTEPLDEVLASRGRFDGMHAVAYELLPHRNRWDAAFVEKVRLYSEHVETDILALADGAALFPATAHAFDYIGDVVRYRKGICDAYSHG